MVIKKSATVDVVDAGRLYCGLCAQVTNHRTLSAVHFEDRPDDEPWVHEMRLAIIQCAGCEHPSFVREIEYEDHIDTLMNPKPIHQRFPNVLPGLASSNGPILIPLTIHHIHRETLGALASGFPILAGVGIRAVIEALCKDRGIKVKDLSPKIDELARQGLVTAPAAKVLHQLRFLGNTAAHEVKEHTTEELLVAMKVIDNILDNIYTLPRAWSEGLPSKSQP